MIRIAHATDIHWAVQPSPGDLFGKRLIGAANLYLGGRRHHFQERVQAALVDALRTVGADGVVITGDLTALALPAEFEIARRQLDPLLAATPTLIQHGNHDVYTRGAAREQRLAKHFGPWMRLGDDGIARMEVGGVHVVGLDPNRPHALASGFVPEAQLAALPQALGEVPADRPLILALHYPVVDRRGAIYEGVTHGLRNARALVTVLRDSRRRPDLIVHGHVHHGFQARLDLGDAFIPVFNPGAGGYAWLPDHDRAGCFNVYVFDDGAPVHVERYRFDGVAFVPEVGGAYASGR